MAATEESGDKAGVCAQAATPAPAAVLAVVADASGGGDPLSGLVDVVEAAAAALREALLVVPYGERLVLLVVDGGAGVRACAQYAAALEAGRGTAGREVPASGEEAELVMGLSAPAGPIAAATAYKQAEQALSVARRRGRALVEHEELAAGSVLPLLADDAVRAFADGLLRALHEHDAPPAAATSSPRSAPGSPATASGTPQRQTSASTATPCATACAAWKKSSAAPWTTRTSAWSCGCH